MSANPSGQPAAGGSSSSNTLLASTYFVETIFPTEDVHMIAGTSGAGKTTWLIDFITRWQKGESVFGYASHPRPFMYVSLDRGLRAVHRIFARMRIDPATFPHYVPSGAMRRGTVIQMLKSLKQTYPHVEVFFIEGFQTAMPNDGNINDNKAVKNYLIDLQELCEALHISIVGVGQAPKSREEDRYTNPRQRISGAAAWAHHLETIVIVEQRSPDTPTDTTRQIYILPRNAPEKILWADFRDGLLVERQVGTKEAKSNWDKLSDWHTAQPNGAEYTAQELVDAIGIPRRSLFLELEKPGAASLIAKTAYGKYRVIKPDPTRLDLAA